MNSERFTQFPENRKGETPLNLWEKVYPAIPHPRQETYISTPLTSGPAKKHIMEMTPQLPIEEVISRSVKANSSFVDTVITNLPDQNGNILTIPYHVGKRDGWGELEYSSFWMNYLSGVSVQKATDFEQHARSVIKKDVFNDYTASPKKRLGEYSKLVDAYGDFMETADLNPVAKIIFVPGYEGSLGCTAERLLAERLNIKREFIIFDSNHPEYNNKIANSAPWLKNHQQIRPNGGQQLVNFTPSL